MHTFLFVLPALHALVLFVVAVLLIKTIVALKSKPVFLSQTQLYASELKIPAPDSTLIKKKRAKAGKSKLTSTHQSRQIRRPAYPRYRISRLKGTKRQSRPCYRKMTLYTYLRVKKRRMISRFSKATVSLPQRCRQFCSCRDRQRDQVWPDHRDPYYSYHLNINHPCKIQAKGFIKVKYGS